MTETVSLLVVEDEALVLLDLQESLEEGGYSVVAAVNGREAMEVLEAGIADIRALITDIDLGAGGVSGWDIAKRAREAQPNLPVIYMTGASGDQWASRGVPQSVLLHKPFATAQVLTAVSQLINDVKE